MMVSVPNFDIGFTKFHTSPFQRRSMSKRIFVNFVSDPNNDPMKTIVGLACASRAVADGHDVHVFFAAAGVRLLEASYIEGLEAELDSPEPMVRPMMDALVAGATLHCSFGSLKAVLGISEGDGALLVADDQISWSGPPGVIALSTASDVQLMY